jgi:TonB family protein
MLHRLATYFLFISCFLLGPRSAYAQFGELDHLADQIAKKLRLLKPRMVAVSTFTVGGGSESKEGEYFSSLIISLIQYHGEKKIHVADRDSFEKFMAQEKIANSDLSSPDSLRRLFERAKLDFVVMGTLDKGADQYTFDLKVIRLPDGVAVDDRKASVRRTEFMDSLAAPFPPKTDYPIYRAGKDGVSTPSCVHCPDPDYPEYARIQGVQGTAVVEAIISPQGQATHIHPVKFVGFGLDEIAYKTVKQWKLKPARNKDGLPVAVIVPVEVTFRLY